jgi:hypothetical protein
LAALLDLLAQLVEVDLQLPPAIDLDEPIHVASDVLGRRALLDQLHVLTDELDVEHSVSKPLSPQEERARVRGEVSLSAWSPL